MQATRLAALALLASLPLAACGRRPAPASKTAGADDLVTLDVTDERRADVVNLVSALSKAQKDGSALTLVDLTQIVELAPADRDIFRAAYPNALKVECAGGVCSANGSGSAAKAAVIATGDDLKGVSMGVKSELSATFKVLAEGRAVRLCDVEGVYFAKSIARKNLKALEISLTPDGGTVQVWLAGAGAIPSCD